MGTQCFRLIFSLLKNLRLSTSLDNDWHGMAGNRSANWPQFSILHFAFWALHYVLWSFYLAIYGQFCWLLNKMNASRNDSAVNRIPNYLVTFGILFGCTFNELNLSWYIFWLIRWIQLCRGISIVYNIYSMANEWR